MKHNHEKLKRVRLRLSMEYVVKVPESWDEERIEDHRNDGSWCADNLVDELVRVVEDCERRKTCLCLEDYNVHFKYMKEGVPNESVQKLLKNNARAVGCHQRKF